ncbi:MAG: hypothetical protein DRQ40_10280, partial [Gammaproteobacteria bacterium]
MGAEQDRVFLGIHERHVAEVGALGAADEQRHGAAFDHERVALEVDFGLIAELATGASVSQRTLEELGRTQVTVAYQSHWRLTTPSRVVAEAGITEGGQAGVLGELARQRMGRVDGGVVCAGDEQKSIEMRHEVDVGGIGMDLKLAETRNHVVLAAVEGVDFRRDADAEPVAVGHGPGVRSVREHVFHTVQTALVEQEMVAFILLQISAALQHAFGR